MKPSLGKMVPRTFFVSKNVVRNGQIDGPPGSGGGDLEGPPEHGGDAGRVMAFPGDLGELAVHLLLVESGPGTQEDLVVPPFVVQKPSRDHDGRPVPAGVVHLPGGLGRSGDDVHVHEGRITGDLVVPVGHGDDDAFVQTHDELHGLIQEGVEEADLEGPRVGEHVLHPRGLHLLHQEFAAGSGEFLPDSRGCRAVMASADLTVVLIPAALTPMAPRDCMKSRRERRWPMKPSTRSRIGSLRVLGRENTGECGRRWDLRKGRDVTVSLLTGLTVRLI